MSKVPHRGTQRENFSKILEISFSAFLDCFCSDFLAENLGRRKFQETESYPPNFRAADGSPKMLDDLILHSKRHICPSENNRNYTKVRRNVSPKKALAFTAIDSKNLRRFRPYELIFPGTSRWAPLTPPYISILCL